MILIKMTSQDFAKLMEEFAQAVTKKEYKKISYDNWRKLKLFTVYLSCEEVYLSLSQRKWRITHPGLNTLYIPCDDMSFGAFLSNRLGNTCSTDYTEAYYNNNNNTNEEKKKTMKLFDNFDFGPVDGDKVRMSAYGMAIKNAAGTWVAYDAKNKNIMDVEIFNFDGSKFMYKMPVAVNAVAVGDIVIHMKKPAYVTEVKANSFMVIDAYDGSIKEILPTKNCFNFNYMTKVVSFVDFGNANSANPFGNMLPFILMDSDDFDSDDILPLMLFSQSGNANIMQNPMLMYFLLNKGNNSDMLLPLMLAGSQFNPFGATGTAAPQSVPIIESV